jgi:hypothetical protein
LERRGDWGRVFLLVVLLESCGILVFGCINSSFELVSRLHHGVKSRELAFKIDMLFFLQLFQ